MGLFDSFRLSNSTRIPEFAGSAIPELQRAQLELNNNYDTANNTNNKVGVLNDTTPMLPNDQEAFKAVHAGIAEGVKAISTRPDKENLVAETDQLARKAALQLKPFGDRMAGYQAYIKSVEESGNDATTQKLLTEKALEDDRRHGKGIYTDPTTGQLVGKFTGPTPAKYVDIPAWTDKMIKDAVPATSGSEHVKIGNQWMVKTGDKMVRLEPARIKQILAEAYKLSPEVQAHVEQQAGLAGFATSRNFTEADFAHLKDGELKAAVGANIARGMSARDAMETVAKGVAHKGLVDTMMGYASDKYQQNDRFHTEDKHENPAFGRAEARRDAQEKEARENTGITVPGTVDPLDPTETLDKVREKIVATNTQIDEARKVAGQWVQLDKDGQPLMVDGRRVPVAGVNLAQAPLAVQNAVALLDTKVAERKQLEYRRDATMDEAAFAQGYRGKDGSRMGAYKAAQEAINTNVANAFKKDIPMNTRMDVLLNHDEQHLLPPSEGQAFKDWQAGKDPTTKVKVGRITAADVYKELTEGKAKVEVKDGQTRIRMASGIAVTPPTSAGSILGLGIDRGINNASNILDRIHKNGNDNYQLYAKNSGTVTPAASLDLNTPTLKAVSNNVINTISSYRGDMAWTDAEGKPVDKEDVAAINLKDAEAGVVKKVGNSVEQSVTVNKDGVQQTYRVTFPATSNIGPKYHELTRNSTDPGLQEFSQTMNPQSQNQDIARLQPNGQLTVRGTKNLVIERSNDNTSIGYSIGLRKDDGSIEYLTDKSGMKFHTVSPIAAELEALKHK